MRAILTVDATNEKNGIVNETVLVWNRQWCSDIHYICVSVILILFEGCNMSSNENMTENLQSYLNFLSPGINLEKLFNIATGKTTSLETKEFLHKTYSSILAKTYCVQLCTIFCGGAIRTFYRNKAWKAHKGLHIPLNVWTFPKSILVVTRNIYLYSVAQLGH